MTDKLVSNDYRQLIEPSDIRTGFVSVFPGKYVLARMEDIPRIKVVLGSCTSLFGFHRGIGFATHIDSPKNARSLISHLKDSIKTETGLILEHHFRPKISGGNRVNQGLTATSPWKDNIAATFSAINRPPDGTIHLWENRGNALWICLKTGQVESHPLK